MAGHKIAKCEKPHPDPLICRSLSRVIIQLTQTLPPGKNFAFPPSLWLLLSVSVRTTYPSLCRSMRQQAPEFGFPRPNMAENTPSDISAETGYINPANISNHNNYFLSSVGRVASAPIHEQLPPTTSAISSMM